MLKIVDCAAAGCTNVITALKARPHVKASMRFDSPGVFPDIESIVTTQSSRLLRSVSRLVLSRACPAVVQAQRHHATTRHNADVRRFFLRNHAIEGAGALTVAGDARATRLSASNIRSTFL